MTQNTDPDTKLGITKSQEACRVTREKDPCWRENRVSMKWLDDNFYNKGACQREFENYKTCKTFWNSVSWARRRAGLYPLIPESEEERNMFKTKYRETGKIPLEL